MPASSSPNMGPPFAQSGARSPGWIFVILGAVCVIWPSIATMTFERLIAAFIGVFGITGLLFWRVFRSGVVGPIGLGTAVVALVLGVVLLVQPMAGARTLTLILGALIIAGWRAGSSWMIGWLFGIHLLTTGIALLTINWTGLAT